ncbi:hydrophobic/amphiphilic exporter-1, HAE1 family [Desulfatibacillum alkenivorans DSM 16219]|uniref:Hydrophobic/amphiphilic exporter-1, HAE1 family n=1 Tax=Desulfatibacillum alkenivorans DSM 16219 TaxID=1121393 RepID=A0A1M6FTV9_9BACT|nr:efflux RND transporter permease subunit [Desulfatibacillum alkenivorans]SHJ01136.1 hydrophobic/amphiphilic exporter-1, HAE1 family [Desulfatibacillum alkenivorans DSM 16219]
MEREIAITKISLNRPVTTIVLVLAAIFFGFYSYRNMGLELYPNVDIPVVSVSTILTGASPEIIDRDVTDVLEEQLNTIEGIKNIESSSYEGRSIIVIEFVLERDIDAAAADVRAKVNLAQYYLPSDCEDPIVSKLDVGAFPVMNIAVKGGEDYRTRSHFVDKVVKPRLQTLSGVGSVDLVGFRDREIRVWLKPADLEAQGLTASDVAGALARRHLELPGGRIENDTQELSIRVEGEYATVEGLSQLVVKESLDGRLVRLRDVAKVEDGFEDVRTGSYLNGSPVITVQVKKQPGVNEVQVCNRVKEVLDDLRSIAPAGIEMIISSDTSDFISRSMNGVENDLMIGVVLTALLMFVFLRSIRVTIVAIISIPTCLISTFLICNALGFTVNNLTMLAMSLAVGMVVDNTIVVIENIFRHLEQGKPVRQAALVGAGQVGFAVMAGTATTLAVFVPVATMKGVIGRFFFSFGMTIAGAMLISLLVSLTLTPFMASHLMKRQTSEGTFSKILDLPMKALEALYRRVLGWAVRFRFVTILFALLTFAAGIMMAKQLGMDFAPEEDQGETTLQYELPIGVSVEESARMTRELSAIVQEQPEVTLVLATFGGGSGEEIHKGNLYIRLVGRKERSVSVAQFEERLRDLFAGYRDVMFQIQQGGGGPGSSDAEQTIQADSLDDLARVAKAMVEDLKKAPGLVDVNSDLRLTKPMVKIQINRGLTDSLGVDVKDIANEVNTYFGGTDASVFKSEGNRYDIVLKGAPEDRMAPDDIGRITVKTSNGDTVRLGAMVDVETTVGPNVIKRYNRRYSASVYANVQEGYSTGQATQDIQAAFDRHSPSDKSMATVVTGNAQMMMESMGYLVEAIIIALIIVYIVMAIQFESFLNPLVVMFSLPLAFSGVFGLIWITGGTINIMSMIGMILLVGIVVNNAILLVDFANQRRERGLGPVEAMLEAGPLRLRPIIMTAASTMISSLPIALALSEGSEFRQPMSLAVIGGLFTSTVLTLVVIPVGYIWVEKISSGAGRLYNKLFKRKKSAPEPPDLVETPPDSEEK